MRKRILMYEEKDLYCSDFRKFMENMQKLDGVDCVAIDGYDMHYVYHFPQGVTLKYEKECRMYESNNTAAIVTLFGNEQSIGEVEKIILDQAKKDPKIKPIEILHDGSVEEAPKGGLKLVDIKLGEF